MFQNLGDGTLLSLRIMAIRAAVAAGVNITYKVLANGAIAMTGGQQIEGKPQDGAELVPDIVRQLPRSGSARSWCSTTAARLSPRWSLPRGRR